MIDRCPGLWGSEVQPASADAEARAAEAHAGRAEHIAGAGHQAGAAVRVGAEPEAACAAQTITGDGVRSRGVRITAVVAAVVAAVIAAVITCASEHVDGQLPDHLGELTQTMQPRVLAPGSGG